MCMDADEMAVVLHSRQQTARKPHRCGECGRTINPGERYTDERLVWDSQARTLKTCPHCMSARAYLGEHCHGWVYTAVEEDLQSHYYGSLGNTAEERRLRLLAIGLRENWTRHDGRLWPVPPLESPNVFEMSDTPKGRKPGAKRAVFAPSRR